MIQRRDVLNLPLVTAAGLLPTAASAQTDPAAARATFEAAIWRSPYDDTRVWGYVDRHSVVPGEKFDLMLSTGPGLDQAKGRIEIFRIGAYADGDRKLVWRSEPVAVARQPVQITAAAIGTGWTASLEQIPTGDWTSGYYAIDFVDDSDGLRNQNVAFIVATPAGPDPDILIGLSSNTWQAYNEWGGYSLYVSDFIGTNAQTVSFDRPCAPGFLDYDYYIATFIEVYAHRHGLRVGYATNFDLFRDPTLVERCRLFVSGGHNEYWSLEEFQAAHRRIFESGGNTIFMGANTAYWQIRYGDQNGAGADAFRGRQLVCFKSLDDPIRFRGDKTKSFDLITMRFRDEARWPETMLMGVAYQSWFSREVSPPIRFPYRVACTDLPFFEGTGYAVGDEIADVVGYEWDNTDPNGDGARLWEASRSRIPALDRERIQILFTGDPVDVDGKRGKAEAAYFESPVGAKVFSSGSIRWCLGLGAPGFVQEPFRRFNTNLLTHMLG
jgi:hypothetical protein